MVTVSVERRGGALWVTVTCAVARSKRASAEADKAARQWARTNNYRHAFRRSSSQARTASGVRYKAVFALH